MLYDGSGDFTYGEELQLEVKAEADSKYQISYQWLKDREEIFKVSADGNVNETNITYSWTSKDPEDSEGSENVLSTSSEYKFTSVKIKK